MQTIYAPPNDSKDTRQKPTLSPQALALLLPALKAAASDYAEHSFNRMTRPQFDSSAKRTPR